MPSTTTVVGGHCTYDLASRMHVRVIACASFNLNGCMLDIEFFIERSDERLTNLVGVAGSFAQYHVRSKHGLLRAKCPYMQVMHRRNIGMRQNHGPNLFEIHTCWDALHQYLARLPN